MSNESLKKLSGPIALLDSLWAYQGAASGQEKLSRKGGGEQRK